VVEKGHGAFEVDGSYDIRIAVHDEASGRLGATRMEVIVPGLGGLANERSDAAGGGQ